jgi:hypothetical protein
MLVPICGIDKGPSRKDRAKKRFSPVVALDVTAWRESAA